MTSVWGRRIALASCGIACLSTEPVLADTQPAGKKHYAIPAQGADTAIDAIGRQGNSQIVASRKILQHRRTNDVQGDFTPTEALTRLLVGTGLTIRQLGPQIYAVVARPDSHDDASRRPALAKAHSDRSARPLRRFAMAAIPIEHQAIDPIVVTGSLVISNGNRSPTPVTTMASLPAGPLKLAIMAEWRRSVYDVTNNATPSGPVDCRGIEYNCSAAPAGPRYLGG